MPLTLEWRSLPSLKLFVIKKERERKGKKEKTVNDISFGTVKEYYYASIWTCKV